MHRPPSGWESGAGGRENLYRYRSVDCTCLEDGKVETEEEKICIDLRRECYMMDFAYLGIVKVEPEKE